MEVVLQAVRERPFRSTPSGLLAHLALCLERRDEPLSAEVLEGLFGHAFESSYARKGEELWFGCDLEWTHHGRGLARVDAEREVVQMVGKPRDGLAPTAERWQQELERGWSLVERALHRGQPVLGWSLMSAAQAQQGVGAYCWGVVYGCDPSTREYLVRHRDAGLHRVRFDALGRIDSVNWFCLVAFSERSSSRAEWDDACRSALRDGVRLLRGELTSASSPAPPRALVHGSDAMVSMAEDVEGGACAQQRAVHLSRMWARARGSAEVFCRWAAPRISGGSSAHTLERAADIFGNQASAFDAAGAGNDLALHLRRAAQIQRDAVDAIKLF